MSSTITATETPTPTGCQPWCNTDDPFNHYDDEGALTETHSRELAAGTWSNHYGPIYMVALQHSPVDGTRLWVSVETATLTADQAEVLGRSLLEGAAALRASSDSAAEDNVCPPYESPRGLVRPPHTVFESTQAEQETAESPR